MILRTRGPILLLFDFSLFLLSAHSCQWIWGAEALAGSRAHADLAGAARQIDFDALIIVVRTPRLILSLILIVIHFYLSFQIMVENALLLRKYRIIRRFE